MAPIDPPTVSVFTPSHNATWLYDCYQSLLKQTFTDWEWIVVLNGDAYWGDPPVDARVKIVATPELRGVGAAKAYACRQAEGEVLVEFDHDDLMLPTALERVVEAYRENPDAGMYYSQFAEIDRTGSPRPAPYSPSFGWTYKEVMIPEFDADRPFVQINNMAPTPHNASHIWYMPNHLRAFTIDAYRAVGGYDADRDVLDDQDLMMRLYRYGPFIEIDECLYLQRVHEHNTQAEPERNAFIQEETIRLYERDIQANAMAWAKHNGLVCLDLGSATGKPEGYIGIDLQAAPDVAYVGDVFEILGEMADDSVGVIRAVDFLEHIGPEPDKRIGIFNEIYRVLAHGGMLLSLTPSSDGRGAFQDPTHVSFYNDNSFWYYTDAGTAQFVPAITARFQASRITTSFPTDWHRANGIPYVQANLIAVKPGGSRQGGLSGWPEPEVDES